SISTGIALLCCLAIAGTWVAILSSHYKHLTVSTSARIAHAIIGPPGVERSHPTARMILKPAPGRVTPWEDPSNLPYAFWSPFAFRESFIFQLKQVLRNAGQIWCLLPEFDWFALSTMAAVGLLGSMIWALASAPRAVGTNASWRQAAIRIFPTWGQVSDLPV